MRRTRRRIIRLLAAVMLVVSGGVLALVFYPLFPAELKDALAIERDRAEDLRDNLGESSEPESPTPIPEQSVPGPPSTPSKHVAPSPIATLPSREPPLIIEPKPTGGPTVTLKTLHDQKAYLLELINADRASFGLSPVELGSNPAAQDHAEEMLEHSYLSHWGLNGMKPYMRYTLAGGMNYEAENISGVSSPPQAGVRYRTISPREELKETEKGWMESSGHRASILNPWHRRVNIGIACNRITCAAVQQFEGDYIEFEEPPTLSSGMLTVAGKLLGGFKLSSIQIWYDRPPHQLTLGQLDRTRCYSVGERPVAFLREPLPSGTNYLPDLAPFTWNECSSPYDVSPDTPRRSLAMPTIIRPGSSKAPWVTAQSWQDVNGRFRVQADLSGIVGDHRPGVYTVLVWGELDGEDVALTRYSIFLE